MYFVHTGKAVVVFGVGGGRKAGKFARFDACGIKAEPTHAIFYLVVLISNQKVSRALFVLMVNVGKKALGITIRFIVSRVAVHDFCVNTHAPFLVFAKPAPNIYCFTKTTFTRKNLSVSGYRGVCGFFCRHINNSSNSGTFTGGERT